MVPLIQPKFDWYFLLVLLYNLSAIAIWLTACVLLVKTGHTHFGVACLIGAFLSTVNYHRGR